MAMRLSGLMSGMDTESIISELVAVRRTKVDDVIKAQKKLQWKQEAWKDLNTQILKLYNGSLSNMRFESSFIKKTTKVSNPNAVSVITGENATNSVQNLKITELARSAYMTGGKLQDMSAPDGNQYTTEFKNSTSLTKSVEEGGLGLEAGSLITVAVNGENTSIEITEDMTIKGFAAALQKAGVNASFDEKNQRFFISSKETGAKQSFTLTGGNAAGAAALDSLGISSYGDAEKAYFNEIIANQDATLQNRLDSKLDSILAERDELVEKQDEMLNLLTSKYYSTFSEVYKAGDELTEEKLAEIQEKIDEVVGKDSEIDADLKNWVADYKANVDAIENIETTQLQATDDGYALSDDVKAAVEAEVAAEVAYAEEALQNMSGGGTAANKMEGSDAAIELNGVTFESNTNTFEINGLTLTVNAKTADGEEITITTEDDTDGIYDMVKNFIKEYNALINQMDKLYNADSASEYEPLTDEEKAEMSETAVEEWEKKIKDALLRKDSSLSTISSAMKEIMMQGVSVNGKQMYLSDFGIETLSYFTAAENEKNAYHIAGDPDDASTSGNADKLKSMIANDPDTVVEFFTNLSKTLYSKMTNLMRGTEYSSAYTAYDDKKMKEEYDDYTSKIAELEDELNDYEDKWYQKFAAMETAMAKLQSNANAVTSMLGGM